MVPGRLYFRHTDKKKQSRLNSRSHLANLYFVTMDVDSAIKVWKMQSIYDLLAADASQIEFVCTDIDDTLTKNGKLGTEAYQSLWRLHSEQIHLIPVTGRPAGWCDLIARQWPVDAVVGENGAFAFYERRGLLKHLYHPSIATDTVKERFAVLKNAVLREIPEARIAKDQFSRMFDLAIDFREEPPDLGYKTAERIAEICREHGAKAKVSSIHVNTWYGDYDKVAMVSLFLKEIYDIDDARQNSVVFFCGDSPNDEPMFERFPMSCGVANITETTHLMKFTPRFITSEPFGRGFAEFVEVLMEKRKALPARI